MSDHDRQESSSLPRSGSARMRARARLIALLGDELVSDERVAVVELVKNAYDADASRVEVRFEGANPLSPDTLVIADDGCGMSLETVLGSWFEPGTIHKKNSPRSPAGRLYQGAKGIGRFAAARLAESMYLETKVEGASEGVTVLLEWGRFDDASFLDEVALTYSVEPLPDLKRGTVLTLVGLRNKKEWDADSFRNLHDRLSRLLSPFSDVSGFSVHLLIPGYPELTGEVEPHALTQRPKYRLSGTLSGSGSFSGKIEVDGVVSKTFSEHGLGKKGEEVACGGFEVEIRAWDRDRSGLTPLMIEFDLGLRELRQLLDVYSGVSIYRDGFRVHPYGEPGNDWLQLDNRSRQSPTNRLANNQLIAALRISRDGNPDLVDRTTREGLVHNPAYNAFREWVGRILALLEAERYRARPREEPKDDSETKTLFEVFDLSNVVVEANRQLGPKHPIAKLVKDSDVEIREGVQRLQEHYSRLLMTAGIGQMVDLVIHEMGAPIGRANREVAYLERRLGELLDDGALAEIRGTFISIKGWLEQLVALRNRLDPKAAGKRGRSTTFDVAEEVQGNLLLFENLLGKQGVTVSVSMPSDPVVVHMTRAALGQILANLLDNSVYWLTRHHGDGAGGKVDIRVSRLPTGFSLLFSDDGPGVPLEDRERVFDPYYSTKPNGMGLGLYILRQIMERYGKFIYRDDCSLSGSCFEASFTKNVGL